MLLVKNTIRSSWALRSLQWRTALTALADSCHRKNWTPFQLRWSSYYLTPTSACRKTKSGARKKMSMKTNRKFSKKISKWKKICKPKSPIYWECFTRLIKNKQLNSLTYCMLKSYPRCLLLKLLRKCRSSVFSSSTIWSNTSDMNWWLPSGTISQLLWRCSLPINHARSDKQQSMESACSLLTLLQLISLNTLNPCSKHSLTLPRSFRELKRKRNMDTLEITLLLPLVKSLRLTASFSLPSFHTGLTTSLSNSISPRDMNKTLSLLISWTTSSTWSQANLNSFLRRSIFSHKS